MNYTIQSADETGVRLRQTSSVMIIPIIGAFLGSLLFLIGLGVLLSSGFTAFAGAFLLGGLFFCTAPWLFVGVTNRLEPQEIFFSNSKAAVYVVNSSKHAQSHGVIPYSEIESFAYYSRSESSGADSTVVSRTVYDVCFYKRDATSFVLFKGLSRENRAQELVELFSRDVHLSKSATQISLGALPKHINLSRSNRETRFSWHVNINKSLIVFVVMFFTTFFGLLALFTMSSNGSAEFSFAVKLIGGVGVCIACAFIFGLLRNRGADYCVNISEREITSGILRNGELTKKKSIALSDVHSCGVNNELNTHSHTLYVHSKNYIETVKRTRITEPSISDMKELFTGTLDTLKQSLNLPHVETGTLPLADLITLENYINHEIARQKNEESAFSEHQNSIEAFVFETREVNLNESFFSKLTANRTLGTISVLGAAIPVVQIAMMLAFVNSIFFAQIRYTHLTLDAVQLSVAGLCGWKLIRAYRYRFLAVMLIIMVLFRAYAVFIDPMSQYFIMQTLMLSILMILGGWQLLKRPQGEEFDQINR
jgi:hypothetical protein